MTCAQVLDRLAAQPGVANALNLTAKTVANYHYAVRTKLGVSSDIDLVYY